jgi:hypothetical protein
MIQHHRFNAGAAHHVDDFVERHAPVLDEFYHGQRSLAVADQNSVSVRSPTFPCLSIVWWFRFRAVLPDSN